MTKKGYRIDGGEKYSRKKKFFELPIELPI